MKTTMSRILGCLALLAIASPSVYALPEPAPDAGSSALLLALAVGGVAFGKSLFRRK